MNRRQITLLVKVDLDPVPGEFATRESWKRQLQGALNSIVGHYHPQVEVGDPTLSLGATHVLKDRLLALDGYTEVIADAVVDNYPIEICEANDWTDLFSYRPVPDEQIALYDKEDHLV